MTTKIIDQTSDPGYATLRVVVEKFPGLREMSKTASIDENEFDGLSRDSFAWISQRRFPIHTKEHTALSLGYRKLAHAVPQEVDELLCKAAALYGIDLDTFNPPKMEKVANEYWLLPEIKRFRITSPEDIKPAEEALFHKFAELTVNDRAEAFSRLVDVARHHEVKLSPSTYKLAGFVVTSTRKLKDYLEARQVASGSSPIGKAFAKMAESYRRVPEYWNDRAGQVKLAQAIHELDKEAGISRFYGSKIPDPILTVFNTEKLSEDQVNIGTGMMMDKNKLAALPLSFWEDLLGPEIAKEISPDGQTVDANILAQLLPTLPADTMAVAQRQLAAYK